MLKLKSIRTIGKIILLYCLTISNIFALNLYQETSVNNDRSGKLKLTYWEETSKIKGSTFYKSLPFSEDKIRAFYSSDNNTIEKINISKNNPETTYVNVFINFKDILKINSAEGFSTIKPTWFKTGDSTTFLYQFEKNEEFSNIASAIYKFELPTKEILRSSENKKNESFFSVKVKPESFVTGITVFAVFENSTENSTSDKSVEDENTNQESEKDNKENKKGCGVFSIELPIVIGLGLFLKRRNFRKRS